MMFSGKKLLPLGMDGCRSQRTSLQLYKDYIICLDLLGGKHSGHDRFVHFSTNLGGLVPFLITEPSYQSERFASK